MTAVRKQETSRSPNPHWQGQGPQIHRLREPVRGLTGAPAAPDPVDLHRRVGLERASDSGGSSAGRRPDHHPCVIGAEKIPEKGRSGPTAIGVPRKPLLRIGLPHTVTDTYPAGLPLVQENFRDR